MSVPATESAPELGGWRDDVYAPSLDPASSLGQAYLSLPYGSNSHHFREPGYFQNVQRFAPEFDLILRHLPHSGRLLDIGADGTWSTAQLARRGLTCIALDITDHLALARLFQTSCPPYALINVDMHEPVFTDESFDVVTAFNAMHHSKRLDQLVANLSRVLKPGGVLGFIEPYVQNAKQEADFGAPQTAHGINENVHTLDRWHRAFSQAGMTLELFSLSDSFNAIYRKQGAEGAGRAEGALSAESATSAESTGDIFEGFYDAVVYVSPTMARMTAGRPFEFTVSIESRGRGAWASRGPIPLRLSYHVSRVTPVGTVMVSWDNPRTILTDFISPNRPAAFVVPVTLNEPGTYELEFDLVHEARTWFGEAGGRTARALVTIE